MSNLRLRYLAIIVIALTLQSCATFFGPPPITAINLCSPPNSDNASILESIRTELIANNDIDAAQLLISQHVSDVACEMNTSLYASFGYTGPDEGPGVNLGTACLSLSVIERRRYRPRFEQWSSCNKDTVLKYWNDFNNIVTENRDMDSTMRYAADVPTTKTYIKNFDGKLKQRLYIQDYGDFMNQGVYFEIDHAGSDIQIIESMSINY